MKLLKIEPSTRKDKKMMAVFEVDGDTRLRISGRSGILTLLLLFRTTRIAKKGIWLDTRLVRTGVIQLPQELYQSLYFGISQPSLAQLGITRNISTFKFAESQALLA